MEDGAIPASHVLSVEQYVQAHARELTAMSTAAERILGNNQPLQRLPRHMRRRAASHNIKRLPGKMHNWARKEMSKAGPPAKTKRPSRRFRRRPANLLLEYARRRRRFVWLETHIWHAKRFHMAETWGYKIPAHPNDKGARATYRASAKYCLLQDLSYLCCVEIQGEQGRILAALSRLCSKDTGLTFGARAYLSGRREGGTVLYRRDQYPQGALGPVTFVWRAGEDWIDPGAGRQLWVWAHPAMYADLMGELQAVVSPGDTLQNTEGSTGAQSTDKSVEGTETQTNKTDTAPIPNVTFSNNVITVTSLKETLCRFSLKGPLSNEVLFDTLKVATSPAQDTTGRLPEDVHKRQAEFWDRVKLTQSPAELPPSCVLGLTVWDPRLFLPKKKAMVAHEQISGSSQVGEPGPEVSQSELWESAVRHKVKVTKLTDHEINRRRSEALLPGSDPPPGPSDARLPLLLVQQPGPRACPRGAGGGLGAGWDVVMPGGWGLAVLVALVYRGARVGGLRDARALSREQGRPWYPGGWPDTPAGRRWEVETWRERQQKYDRVPPAKRTSFTKLGVGAPFHSPWAGLLATWGPSRGEAGPGEVYVLRSRSSLRALHSVCSPSSGPQCKQSRRRLEMDQVVSTISAPDCCLVPVQLSVILRGKPAAFSTICLPTADDLAQFAKDSSYGGPQEPIHKAKTKADSQKASGYEEPPVTNINKSGTRPVIGFINDGNFSFASGHGAGLGYVALRALQGLLSADTGGSRGDNRVVLVRTTTSLQYRYARLAVCVV